jgi:hypothetical protein
VHVAPAYVGPWEGFECLTTLSLMYAAFPYISARGCFQDLNRCTRAPLQSTSMVKHKHSLANTYHKVGATSSCVPTVPKCICFLSTFMAACHFIFLKYTPLIMHGSWSTYCFLLCRFVRLISLPEVIRKKTKTTVISYRANCQIQHKGSLR